MTHTRLPLASHQPSPPADTLTKAIAGDRQAQAEMLEHGRSWLIPEMTRLLGCSDEAEDVFHDAFLRLHQHWHRCDPQRNFYAWLYTICQRLALNRLRKRQRWFVRRSTPPHVPDGMSLYQIVLDARQSARPDALSIVEGTRILERTVTTLPPKLRKAFSAVALDGLTNRAYAETCGMSTNTAKTHVHRARQLVRQAVLTHLDLLKSCQLIN